MAAPNSEHLATPEMVHPRHFDLSASRKDSGSFTPSSIGKEKRPERIAKAHDARPWNQYLLSKMSENVALDFAYVPLLACCFLTGLTDSAIYNSYGTFVSMQTGNTIFISLGASGYNNKPFGWALSLCSICSFIVGSFAFSRLSFYSGARRRGSVMLSFTIQTIFIVVAAAIVNGGLIDGSYRTMQPRGSINFNELVIVALLSFQAAGQIVSSRTLKVGDVPTVVITSLLCDMMSDPALFVFTKNDKRDRRLFDFVLTVLGGICGGWVCKVSGSISANLWIVASIKLGVTFSFLIWKKEFDIAV